MRVAVLPTGRMEAEGLAPALAALFPDHAFTTIFANPREREPHHAFTTSRLPIPNVGAAPTALDKLVGEMAAALFPRSRHEPAHDRVLLVDDLELANRDQPEVVVACVRDAVRRHLETLVEPRRARTAARLCERASFHLAVPMVEAWLFADPTSLVAAGAQREARLVDGRDPEAFQSADPDYEEDDGSGCTRWQSKRPRKSEKPLWLKTDDRLHHPKAYLAWLCRSPGEKCCTIYRETTKGDGPSGARALERIDWSTVLSNDAHLRFLRAMVADLAFALGAQNPFPGKEAITGLGTRPQDHVLRNL